MALDAPTAHTDGERLAWTLLGRCRMATRSESLTIPFLVIIWTTLTVGFIMTLVVVLMH